MYKRQAARIIEEARQDADAYRTDKRAEADAEVARIREQAQADVEASRTQAIADIRAEVATLRAVSYTHLAAPRRPAATAGCRWTSAWGGCRGVSANVGSWTCSWGAWWVRGGCRAAELGAACRA